MGWLSYNIRHICFSTAHEHLFDGCSSLASLDAIRDWDTHRVTNMNLMFASCSNLTSLDAISGWDTSSVTLMQSTFSGCSNLTSLVAISDWDIGNVRYIDGMFKNCSNLTSLDAISSWKTGSVTNMYAMFDGCSGLTSLGGISGWDTSKVTDMGYMFYGCSNLTSLDGISGWDTSSVTGMGYMFYGCSNLTSLDGISGWDTSKVTDMYYMFQKCSNLASADLSGWNTGSVTSMNYMFSGCSNLTSLNVSGWNTSKVIGGFYMFDGCSKLAEATLGHGFYASTSISELPKEHDWVFRDKPDHIYTSEELKAAMYDGTALEGTYLWLTESYTLNFEGGDVPFTGSMEPVTVGILLVDYEIPENLFVSSGYIFTGWKDKSTGEDFKLTDGKAVIPAGTYEDDDVVVLVAQWEEELASGLRLPDTGGTGAWPCRSAGATMILAAVALPLLDRRRRCGRA